MPEIGPATTIGIIGVGAMGGAIAECLLRKGCRVIVRDVIAERVDALVARGAQPAASAADVALSSTLVLTVVVDAAQTDAVLFGADDDSGVAAIAAPGSIVVMCSTVAPTYVAALAGRLDKHGVELVDAPISGGPQRARDGTLSMMAAAAPDTLARAQPVLAAFASRLFHVGTRPGDGSAMKIVNNMLAGTNLAAAAEAMALAEKLGMDLALAQDVINASSGGSWIFADRMPRALSRDYTPPRAAAKILAKDMRLALEVAEAAGVPVEVARAAQQSYAGLLAQGLGDADDAALIEYHRARNSKD